MMTYAKPLPDLNDGNRPFWEGALRGEVRVQRCGDCAALRFPASRFCPSCHGENSEWIPVSGRGAIECFCIFHRMYFESFAAEIPYNVALVRLDEGPCLFSNIVGVANDQLRIGMRVVPAFEKVTPDVALVKFRPADSP